MKGKIYRIRRNLFRCKSFSKNKYRKQTQHIRRYRSGRLTFVNRGIRYRTYAGLPHFETNGSDTFSADELAKLISIPSYDIAQNTLAESYFEGAEVLDKNIKSTYKEGQRLKIAEGAMTIKIKNGKILKLIFESDTKKDGVKGYISKIYEKNPSGQFIKVLIVEVIQ